MTFLNPFVLIALLAAGIPLIIHLINLRKPRRIDFSSLAFLEELRQQTIRRLRIRQWLLLALRTLAIAFLVLAFARPTIKSPSIASLTSGHRSVAVVFDNSLSMDLRDARGSYLTQAADFAESLVNELGPSDELAVVPLVDDGTPHLLGRPALVGAQFADFAPSYGLGLMGPALDEAASALAQSNHSAREVYIVTDLQGTNFADSAGSHLSEVGNVVLVPIGATSTPNSAITQVRIASSIVEVDQPAIIEVEIQNFGDEEIRNWGLSVYLEEERVAQSTVTIEPGQTGQISITVTPRTRGWLKGRVLLEDDAFIYDNERFFTLHVPEERKVLMVRGEGRSSEFIDLAFSTELRDGSSLFQLEYAGDEALSGTISEEYDAIVIVGVSRMSPGMAAALATFVQDGGGVMLFAGEAAAAGAYNQFLDQVGAGAFDGLVSAAPGTALTTLKGIDREHPLFSGMFEVEDGTGRQVEQPSIMRLVRYRPGEGDEQTLLATTIGLPMLQEIRYSAGRLLIAPFLPEPEWTDLPLRGLFVPLLFRSMYYLTSPDEGSGVDPGAGSVYRIASPQNGSRLRIVSDSGQEWIPEQRSTPQGLYFTLPATLRKPGIYDVIGDEVLVQRFAVNLDQRESNLARIDATEAARRIEEQTGRSVSVLPSQSSEFTPGELLRAQETGVEIWNVFLTIAFVLLVAEMLVAARWKPIGTTPVST